MKFKHTLMRHMKVFSKASLFAVALGATLSLNAQVTTHTIATGTSTNSNVPINTNWGYNYSQSIFTAQDLHDAGITEAGTISKIAFYNTSPTGNFANCLDWTVYVANSTKTEFTSNTNWEASSSFTTVFSGNITPVQNGWMEIVFTTPFIWDGTSNVIVGVDENTTGYSTTAYFRKSDLGNNRSIYYRSDSNNPDPANPPSASGRIGYVPHIQLGWELPPVCSGTPAQINTSTANTTLCEGSEPTLNSDLYLFSDLSYQWQSSADGTTWTDISGATERSLTLDPVTTTLQYQLVLTCNSSGESTPSIPVTITVNQNPIVTVSQAEAAFCASSSVVITASGANTYAWTPTTGLNVSNLDLVNASPTTTTTYTVTGTDLNGCIGSTTSTVIPMSEVTVDFTLDPIESCSAGSPITATLTGVPTDFDGGIWNYRFLENDGIVEAQTWNTANSFSYIPTEDSVYKFFYQIRNSSCPDLVNDSIAFSFIVGFGGDVIVTPYDCHNLGGIASVENGFGQAEISQVYVNDFTTDMDNITLTGNASFTNGMGILTPSATSNNGHIQLSLPSFSAGTNNSMNVSFDLTADLPINNWGTGGADGITYSFGDDATPTSNGNNPNGRGTKLRLSFDAAGNSTENGNVSGIYLVYGWTANNAFGPTSAQTLAYSPNTVDWKNTTNTPVNLSINAAGQATVTVNGSVIFENVQLPAAYMDADVSTWNHLFSAGTGGDAMRFAIDNLDISTGAILYGISQGSATDIPTEWQTTTSFEDLAPGTYHIWMAKDATANCGKMIETIEITNANPVVDLGENTVICAGETLTLDAGNVGSSYVWNNSNVVSQTIEVTEAGTYVAYVTNADGCVGIGSIEVDVNDVPTANDIFVQGFYPNYTFSVLNAQNASTYDWNFGDGASITNGASSVSHMYWNENTFTVTATLNNACGSTTLTKQVDITNTASLDEVQIEGLSIYPNPTSSVLNIEILDNSTSLISVYSVTGAVILSDYQFNQTATISVSDWNKGVYFIHITNNGVSKVEKVVIN